MLRILYTFVSLLELLVLEYCKDYAGNLGIERFA
jgi:hypothetical protein